MKDIMCRELKSIEITYGVKILHAVESGSRAWGFASPDSDYDVRYIYVRSVRDYLRLDEPRDVIEQIDAEDVLDINGWDIKKALKQFARANATLFEWSNSPVVYKTTGEWAAVYDVAKTYFSEKAGCDLPRRLEACLQLACCTGARPAFTLPRICPAGTARRQYRLQIRRH